MVQAAHSISDIKRNQYFLKEMTSPPGSLTFERTKTFLIRLLLSSSQRFQTRPFGYPDFRTVMASSSIALANTSALGGTGTSLPQILQQSTPGFGFLQGFFKSWLKLDLTTLAATLTIFGTISSALVVLKGFGLKVYWWFTVLFTVLISIVSSDRLNEKILN